MDDETPSTDVTLRATLDERAAAPRGELLAHWFRTATDLLFSTGEGELSDSWALVTESIDGAQEVRVRDVRAHWPHLADALRPSPFYAAAGFREPSSADDSGRIGGARAGRGGSHTELSAQLRGGERIADAAWCAHLVDFLATALDGADPAFARIDHLSFEETTDLEAALKRPQRQALRESRPLLRGYSWVTGLPTELAARLGGPTALKATGAFHAVHELHAGGLLLQATETLAAYDHPHMKAVFHALARYSHRAPPKRPPTAPTCGSSSRTRALPGPTAVHDLHGPTHDGDRTSRSARKGMEAPTRAGAQAQSGQARQARGVSPVAPAAVRGWIT
ncbi:hypothetical protein ACIGG5_10095 [Streptomyces sp. NPDC085463]|uniref:hypothetical protein n=1 Tax=Streptomyces sp. NPDC085463 TaxID=3365724 RepID=UPI0037D95EC7